MPSYTGNDGRQRSIRVEAGAVSVRSAKSSAAPASKPSAADVVTAEGQQVCRPVPASVTVAGGGTAGINQVVCRTLDGNREPA